jgi:hypothetical protein
MVSVTLFVGRFDMRMMQVRGAWCGINYHSIYNFHYGPKLLYITMLGYPPRQWRSLAQLQGRGGKWAEMPSLTLFFPNLGGK